MSGSVWPLAVLLAALVPGAVALAPRGGLAALRLVPLAPLPTLAWALAGAPGTLALPDLLLGVTLTGAPDGLPGGALLPAMTAAIWTAAGLHAALTLAGGPRRRALAGFWSVTLAGNLGVLMAGDVVTFYLAFAAVSLAAWGLVVHDGTGKARAAGRVYLVLAVAGEAALLAGLLIGIDAAGGATGIAEVRAGLEGAALGGTAAALLVAGFGIKAGMVPLHLWLAPAHSAAPVPASAVLSGAIVKAGLAGLVLLLPAQGIWPAVLVGAGLAGGFAAAVWGLTQAQPKPVLAYSTVSQMGLMLAVLGAGGGGAVVLWAVHHGLAKAALFLSVGLWAAARGTGARAAVLALAGVAAASLAGLPGTGGALAKSAAKEVVGPTVALALTLSGATTALLLAWFLSRLSRLAPGAAAPLPVLLAGAAALAVAAHAVPLAVAGPGAPSGWVDALWPVALGLAGFAILRRHPLPELPPGDLLALPRPALSPPRLPSPPRQRGNPRRRALRTLLHSVRIEAGMARWPVTATLLLGMALLLAVLTA